MPRRRRRNRQSDHRPSATPPQAPIASGPVEPGSESGAADSSAVATPDEDGARQRTDPFLCHEPQVELPPIRIDDRESATRRIPHFGRVRVVNTSGFSYRVKLVSEAPWMTTDDAEPHLDPGDEAALPFDVDCGELPPGSAEGLLGVLCRRPFLERRYPVRVRTEVTYHIPVPAVRVTAEEHRSERRISISVRNGGAGILRGRFYDRRRNEHVPFFLRGGRLDDVEDAPAGDEGPASGEFVVERGYDASEDVVGSFVISCDTNSPRFRTIEIRPRDYWRAPLITDQPFVDFLRLDPGRGHTSDIRFLDPDFRGGCRVDVPAEARDLLSCRATGADLRLELHQEASRLDHRIVHVRFAGKRGRTGKIPVLISFRT